MPYRKYHGDGHDPRSESEQYTLWAGALPRGTPLPPGVSVMDDISRTVAEISPVKMMEVLSSMRAFILEHPDRAHALLTANPQLAYALFQALLVYRIIDPGILQVMGNMVYQPGPSLDVPSNQTTGTAHWGAALMQMSHLWNEQFNLLSPDRRQAIQQLMSQFVATMNLGGN